MFLSPLDGCGFGSAAGGGASGLFLLGADSGHMAWSETGATGTWSEVFAGTNAGDAPFHYFGGLYVGAGYATTSAYTSDDKASWTTRTLPAAKNWHAMCKAGATLVAGASEIITDGAATSSDAITWTGRTTQSMRIEEMAYNGSRIVAVGANSASNPCCMTSDDAGVTWTYRTMPTVATTWNRVVWTGTSFISTRSDASNTEIARSTDGATWSSITVASPYTNARMQGLAYGAGILVIVYGSAVGASAKYSIDDGLNWSAATLPTSANWYAVGHNGAGFLAVTASSDAAATSPDGITWTAQTLGAVRNWRNATSTHNHFGTY